MAATASGLGAALVAAPPSLVSGSLAHAAHVARAAADGSQLPPFEVLTPEQAADMDAIASQIIPTDDLPGAHEARVVYFIDHALNSWAANQRTQWITGLDTLNGLVAQRYEGRRFSQLSPAEQLEFLTANENHGTFQQMRFVTVAGMFANPQWRGNFEGAGYRVLGFEPRFVWQPPFGEYDAEPARGTGS